MLKLHGKPRVGSSGCPRRRERMRQWILAGLGGRQIVRRSMVKWGPSERAAYSGLRAARKALGLLTPPADWDAVPNGVRRDGKAFAKRVDKITIEQRLVQIEKWIAAGQSTGAIIQAVMAHWGVFRPQAKVYLKRAWDRLAEPAGRERDIRRGIAQYRYDKIFRDAVTKMKEPQVRKTEIERPKGRTVVTTTTNCMPAGAMEMARHADAMLVRLYGLDLLPGTGRRAGRPPGAAGRNADIWAAAADPALTAEAEKAAAASASERSAKPPARRRARRPRPAPAAVGRRVKTA